MAPHGVARRPGPRKNIHFSRSPKELFVMLRFAFWNDEAKVDKGEQSRKCIDDIKGQKTSGC